MKKKLIAATIVSMMALQPIMAYAQTTEGTTEPTPSLQTSVKIMNANSEEVDPGTLPDSPIYWLTNLIDKLQLALTFDPLKKAQLEEEQALEKLAEATELTEDGKTELAEAGINEYYNKVEKAKEFLAKVEDENSEEAQNLLEAIENTNAKNIEALGVLLEKIPPQAAARVALNIVRSMEKAVDKLSDEQQESIQKHVDNTTKKIEQKELKEETKAALAEFKNALENRKIEREENKEQNKEQNSTVKEEKPSIKETKTSVKEPKSSDKEENATDQHRNNVNQDK
jgi:hypothetical protein